MGNQIGVNTHFSKSGLEILGSFRTCAVAPLRIVQNQDLGRAFISINQNPDLKAWGIRAKAGTESVTNQAESGLQQGVFCV